MQLSRGKGRFCGIFLPEGIRAARTKRAHHEQERIDSGLWEVLAPSSWLCLKGVLSLSVHTSCRVGESLRDLLVSLGAARTYAVRRNRVYIVHIFYMRQHHGSRATHGSGSPSPTRPPRTQSCSVLASQQLSCSFVKRSGRGAPPAAPDAAAACLATARTLTTWPLSVEGSEPVLAVDRYSIIGQLGGTRRARGGERADETRGCARADDLLEDGEHVCPHGL